MMHPEDPYPSGRYLVGVSMRTLLASACLLIVSVSANAADTVLSDSPAIIRADTSAGVTEPAPERWGGVYGGISVGHGFLKDSLPAEGHDWIFGGHVGYNYQMGNFVAGIEGNMDRADIMFEDGSAVASEMIYAARFRAGYGTDRFLVYGTIGVEHGTTRRGNLAFFGVTEDPKDTTLQLGGGVDVALTDKISLGLDYTYAKYKNFGGLADNYPLVFPNPLEVTTQKLGARLTYTFN